MSSIIKIIDQLSLMIFTIACACCASLLFVIITLTAIDLTASDIDFIFVLFLVPSSVMFYVVFRNIFK